MQARHTYIGSEVKRLRALVNWHRRTGLSRIHSRLVHQRVEWIAPHWISLVLVLHLHLHAHVLLSLHLLLLGEEGVLLLHHGWLSTGDCVPCNALVELHLVEGVVPRHRLERRLELVVHRHSTGTCHRVGLRRGLLLLLRVESAEDLVAVLVSAGQGLA